MKYNRNLAARVNSILIECGEMGVEVDPLKLQKLLYLSYGIYLRETGEELPHLSFIALQYGPVSKEVYEFYKENGYNTITKKMGEYGDYPVLVDDVSVKKVANLYGYFPNYKLIDITHREDGAWYQAYKKEVGCQLNINDIKKEFDITKVNTNERNN